MLQERLEIFNYQNQCQSLNVIVEACIFPWLNVITYTEHELHFEIVSVLFGKPLEGC